LVFYIALISLQQLLLETAIVIKLPLYLLDKVHHPKFHNFVTFYSLALQVQHQ